jgi:hypothetical protein
MSEKVKYTEQCIRKTIRSYWWYSTGSPYLFLLIPYTAFLIYRIATDDISWFVWVVGLGVLFYTVMMIYMYITYMGIYLRWFRSMKEPEATLELKEEQLCITVDDKAQEIAWSSINNIRKTDNSWILLLSPKKYNFIILPVIQLTDTEKSFIISKVDAVLYCTDQIWKIRAQLACGHISTFFVFGPMLIKSFPPQWTIFSIAIGGIIAVSGLALQFAIRCPKCRTNWNKKIFSVSELDSLVALRKCPSCEATGSDLKERKITKTLAN